MHMPAILILLPSGDYIENMDINKSEEEENAYYNKIHTRISRFRFRRAERTSWDENKRKKTESSSEERGSVIFSCYVIGILQ
jgi:hypothetical protein